MQMNPNILNDDDPNQARHPDLHEYKKAAAVSIDAGRLDSLVALLMHLVQPEEGTFRSKGTECTFSVDGQIYEGTSVVTTDGLYVTQQFTSKDGAVSQSLTAVINHLDEGYMTFGRIVTRTHPSEGEEPYERRNGVVYSDCAGRTADFVREDDPMVDPAQSTSLFIGGRSVTQNLNDRGSALSPDELYLHARETIYTLTDGVLAALDDTIHPAA
jgi:hypothetical protein